MPPTPSTETDDDTDDMNPDLLDLQNDMARNIAALKGTTMDPAVSSYIERTLWPWLGQLLTVVTAQDLAVQEMADNADEVLYADSAEIIAKPITMAMEIFSKLSSSIPKDGPLAARIVAFGIAATEALAKLEDVVVYDDSTDTATAVKE